MRLNVTGDEPWLAYYVIAVWPVRLHHVEFKQYRETGMAWKTPKIVEVAVGMEINMYACAARK